MLTSDVGALIYFSWHQTPNKPHHNSKKGISTFIVYMGGNTNLPSALTEKMCSFGAWGHFKIWNAHIYEHVITAIAANKEWFFKMSPFIWELGRQKDYPALFS